MENKFVVSIQMETDELSLVQFIQRSYPNSIHIFDTVVVIRTKEFLSEIKTCLDNWIFEHRKNYHVLPKVIIFEVKSGNFDFLDAEQIKYLQYLFRE